MTGDSPAHVGPPVALVTGANKGIGLETVRRLVEAGCRVHLGARNPTLGKAAMNAAAPPSRSGHSAASAAVTMTGMQTACPTLASQVRWKMASR